MGRFILGVIVTLLAFGLWCLGSNFVADYQARKVYAKQHCERLGLINGHQTELFRCNGRFYGWRDFPIDGEE